MPAAARSRAVRLKLDEPGNRPVERRKSIHALVICPESPPWRGRSRPGGGRAIHPKVEAEACEAEIAVNRENAPGIYLDAVPIVRQGETLTRQSGSRPVVSVR